MKLTLACMLVLLAGCAGAPRHHKSNALEYLYPEGASAQPPQDVRLQLPVRVGLAFAPASEEAYGPVDPFTPDRKQALLERMAQAFRGRQGIGSVDVIAASHLSPGGGFAELDRLKQAYGLDLMALVSYDQFQFTETGKSSWTYWTVVGAYIIEGEKNETRTVLDAVIYDIPSRTMLFTASGRSSVKESSTPVDIETSLRADSSEGFKRATDDLIQELDQALAGFQAASAGGTVRGPGTPAVAMVDAQGQPVEGGGGGGAGAAGALDVLLVIAASALSLAASRRA
jgi:rhombotail lipoprotein